MKRTRRGPGRPVDPVRPDDLLDAATRVFARDGFGAARLADIAREIGITKGALAYHHPSKEGLYLAVLSRLTAELGGLVAGALTGGGDWTDRLDRLGVAVTRVVGPRPDAARLLLRELTDGGPFVEGPGGATVSAVLAAVVAFLEEGLRAGLVAPQDPRHLAGTIVSLHLGWFGARTLSAALLGGDPADAAAVAARERELLAQVRRLCGRPPG